MEMNLPISLGAGHRICPLAFIYAFLYLQKVLPGERGFFNSQESREAKNDTNLCSTIADTYAAHADDEQQNSRPVCVRRPYGHSYDNQYVAPILCEQKLR